MSETSTPTRPLAPERSSSDLRPLLLAGVVAAADILTYDHWGLGTTLAFAVMVAAIVLCGRALGRMRLAALAAGLVALIPMLEAPGEAGSLIIAVCGLGFAAVLAAGLWTGKIDGLGAVAARFAILAPVRFLGDGLRVLGQMRLDGFRAGLLRAVLLWVLPVTIGAVFLMLFAAANPLIESALAVLTPDGNGIVTLIAHMFFWAAAAAFVWPFLAPKLLTVTASPKVQGPARPTLISAVTGQAVTLRALILFNLLFALQSGLDLVYLWGGVTLPDGMTYADYAHRGAYPLIVTALLAAGFVLVALRPGSATSKDRLVRGLVYAFIAQNVLLVISSILRLDLYVDIYGLTRLRLAAGIWMGLVALGLVLIVVRIWRDLSNAWLVGANLIALLAVVSGMVVVDLDRVVARFNLDHASEPGTGAVPLHVAYLEVLGPSIIPELDAAIADKRLAPIAPRIDLPSVQRELVALRGQLVESLKLAPDWRDWNWREARLRDYLAAHPTPPVIP